MRRREVIAGLGILLGALLPVLLPSPAYAQDPGQIVVRSLSAEATFVGEQTVMAAGAARPRASQRVFRKGSILRINYPNGQVMFDDGTQMLVYLPRLGIVEKSASPRNGQAVLKQRRALRSGRAQLTLLPEDEVAGRAAYVVSVRPQRGATRKVWVDKQTYIQLRQDITQPNGRTVSTYFTRIQYGQEPPAEMLTFTPPPGAQVVEGGHGRPLAAPVAARLARNWGGLLEPRSLPAGYRFRGFFRHNFKGRPFVVSLYEGPGGNSVSLFQGPALGMGTMTQRKNDLRVVTGRKGSAELMVVGPLPQDELQRMMDSVQ